MRKYNYKKKGRNINQKNKIKRFKSLSIAGNKTRIKQNETFNNNELFPTNSFLENSNSDISLPSFSDENEVENTEKIGQNNPELVNDDDLINFYSEQIKELKKNKTTHIQGEVDEIFKKNNQFYYFAKIFYDLVEKKFKNENEINDFFKKFSRYKNMKKVPFFNDISVYENLYLGVKNLFKSKPEYCVNTRPLIYYLSKYLTAKEASKIFNILKIILINVEIKIIKMINIYL